MYVHMYICENVSRRGVVQNKHRGMVINSYSALLLLKHII